MSAYPKLDSFKLQQIYIAEEMTTKAMNGCKRSIRELYMIMPSLFEQGTRTLTILEPFLYEANEMRGT